MIPFGVNIFPNIDKAKASNNIQKDPPSCFFYLMLYCFTNSIN